MPPTHLKSLQAIELALRHGSLTQAADALSITPAAVGQRIKAIEDYLGLELIIRGRCGLQPTPALSDALQHLRAAFQELEQFCELLEIQKGEEIHIAAPSDFVDLWLAPRLPWFRDRHPKVRFCINGAGDAPYRVGRLDCSISFGPIPASGGAKPLFRDFLLPISSPENASRIQSYAARDRLEGFPLLHLDLYKDDPTAIGWTEWIAATRLRRSAPDRGIRFRRMAHGVNAVLSNAGLMVCGLALISDLVDRQQLALPYPATTGAWTEHVYQARFSVPQSRPQVDRFRKWLLMECRRTHEWLNARSGQRIDGSVGAPLERPSGSI